MQTPLQQALLEAALEEFRDIPEDPEGLPEVSVSEWSLWEHRTEKRLYTSMEPNCRMYFFASRELRAMFIRSRLSQGYRLCGSPETQKERT